MCVSAIRAEDKKGNGDCGNDDEEAVVGEEEEDKGSGDVVETGAGTGAVVGAIVGGRPRL